MKILSKTQNQNNKLRADGQLVNRLGRFLYNNIDGAYKFHKSGNMYDVYMHLYYQIPLVDREKPEDDAMHEMVINLNITTYSNKIRVNVIECDPHERTLGFDLYDPEDMNEFESLRIKIFKRVIHRVEKAYKDYDFIY